MATDKTKHPDHVLHRVTHCQQRFTWDCGVSCVMMLLDEPQRLRFLQNFSSICQEEGFNQSTWTIDLCYLLKRFGIKHILYTTMPGVNEDYKKHSYYNRILDLDRDRVRRRFAEAASAGVIVMRQALSARELAEHVVTRGPALLLVDASRLACDWCRRNKLTIELRRWLGVGGGYRGHYILIVGALNGRVLYRDPARAAHGGKEGLCAAPPAALAAAHAAPGTDHDAVLVDRDYR